MAYKIYRVNNDSVIDFAAQELKKYLRMMMPRCGEIPVTFDAEAKDGFRIGVYSDFGMTANVENSYLDDAVYIKTDAHSGIIAGSNPRAALIAVYRFLRENGCRWLFPGPDGESIPTVDCLEPVSYEHIADKRYRGQCNEGAETQRCMFDAIDFTPKIGLNTFMMEFDIPTSYYKHYYSHKFDSYKEAIPSSKTILQWKRECEVEIQKRGLLFHDMGHGWTILPFGLCNSGDWSVTADSDVSDQTRQYLAQINGKRELYGGIAINTNVCMSNPEVRRKIADYIVDYSKTQNNVDFLHVWLADNSNNHCECDECRKMDTSDWYITLMNDIGDALTKAGLNTHVVFIVYVDTIWPPKQVKINDPDRFTMLFAPITRFYTETYKEDADMSAVVPYTRNTLKLPRGMAENLAYLAEWKKMFKGDCFCYEYHFWRTQFFDLGSKFLSKIIYDDIAGLDKHGLKGIVEDGSQRSFFPNGLCFTIYGEALFDGSRSYESMVEDYYSHAYGSDWRLVSDYLDKVSELSDFDYIYMVNTTPTAKFKNTDFSRFADNNMVEKYRLLKKTVDEFIPVIDAHTKNADRIEFIMWDLLRWHGTLCKDIADAIEYQFNGDEEKCLQTFEKMQHDLAPLDYIRHDCYDHFLCMYSFSNVFKPGKSVQFFIED